MGKMPHAAGDTASGTEHEPGRSAQSDRERLRALGFPRIREIRLFETFGPLVEARGIDGNDLILSELDTHPTALSHGLLAELMVPDLLADLRASRTNAKDR
jgi:hypothetical protein